MYDKNDMITKQIRIADYALQKGLTVQAVYARVKDGKLKTINDKSGMLIVVSVCEHCGSEK